MNKTIELRIGDKHRHIQLPEHTAMLHIPGAAALPRPEEAIDAALKDPIGTKPFVQLVEECISDCEKNHQPRAVIVASDNTRPVPYSGKTGIIWPLVEKLLTGGFKASNITILIATGTHRAVSSQEIQSMFDKKILDSGCRIINHDCRDSTLLEYLGQSERGSSVYINKEYLEADFKILTGLVESHFMAGTSGGRKAICPGLIGEQSTYVFHGPEMLAHPMATDLVLEGNPCHEEALEIAKMAGAHFLLNVTLNASLEVSGVFAGKLESAHEAATVQVSSQVSIPLSQQYDVVVTHGGFVGINHYQCAKAAWSAAKAVSSNGWIILLADNTDTHPVGPHTYRSVLSLLSQIGPQRFLQLIQSPDWSFIPDQWQVQMWAKVFKQIPMDHLLYYSKQFQTEHYSYCPGGRLDAFASKKDISESVIQAINAIAAERGKKPGELSIACLVDGPYAVPFVKN